MGERNWSGLRYTYVVEMLDGTTIGPFKSGMSEVVRWERQNKRGYVDQQLNTEQLLWTAWAAGRRLGLIEDKLFDDWFSKVSDFATEDDDEDVDPTPKDPSPE